MKIVYLHQYFVTPTMAGGTRSYEMGRRLAALGHDVHVVTADQSGQGSSSWKESVEGGIKVHWANVRYNNTMSFMRRLLAFFLFAFKGTGKALRLKGDVIFATSTPLTIAIPALIVSAWTRVPFVFEVRDLWPDVPIAIGAIRNPLAVWAARALEKITYRRAAHIVVVAPGMKDDIVAKGVPADKITVITQGCDLDVFSGQDSGLSPRDEHVWLGARKLVLYAGTIGIANGVDYLARLARRVREIDPEIRFVVIGAGKERETVVDLASREGVLNNNLFMLDPMPKSELGRWLYAANMHVALFTGPRVIWKDAAQNKFFDAVATGKPIVNNFDGWQSRLAEKEGIGLILDPQDMDKAARKLVAALNDEAWLKTVPAKATALAQGPFDRQKLAERLEKILAAAAEARP